MKANEVMTEMKKVPDTVADSAHKAWLAGLGTVRNVEEESGRVFDRLVKRGEKMEADGRKELKKLRKRVEESVDDLGSGVEAQLKKLLKRFGVPTRDEILTLTHRVEKISDLVDQMMVRSSAPKAVAAAKGEGVHRTVYHVSRHDDGWKVKLQGVDEPTSVHPTKDEAVSAARDLAKSQEPSEVVVHKMDGTIQNRTSYGETTVN